MGAIKARNDPKFKFMPHQNAVPKSGLSGRSPWTYFESRREMHEASLCRLTPRNVIASCSWHRAELKLRF
jgi:hypothetical protein